MPAKVISALALHLPNIMAQTTTAPEPALTPEDARKQSGDLGTNTPTDFHVQRFSPLPTGSRVGDHAIQSVLGAGEFGITYIAVSDGANRRFVIKEYLPRAIAFRDGLTVRVSSANTPAFATGLDRFLNEARTLAKIRHPSVISVLAVFEANGTGYCVMPHEIGRDLGIWLHELRRPLTQAEFDKIAEPLLDGLASLHSKNIFHLDIQPANVIVREAGTPVLVDFGGGRAALRRRLNSPAPSDALPYMAPELVAGDQALIGARSDIYSVAALLYQLATATAPLDASKRMLRDEMPPIAEAARGKLRQGFLQAIDYGLRYRPDDRPHDIALWKDDLFRPDGAAGRPPSAKAIAPEPTRPLTAISETGNDGGDAPIAEHLMDNASFRPLFFGLAGAVCGAIAGALSSIVVASIVWSGCASDSCVAPVVPYTAGIGTLIGLVAGARYGRLTVPAPHKNDDNQGEL